MEPRRYGHLDPWQHNDQAADAAVREQARRIELRGRNKDEIAARAAYLDLLEIQHGERVLEVGCGSGVVLRDIARRVGSSGQAVGLDYSSAFLKVAHELAEQAGLADRIELQQGDARALTLEDAQFDVVLAATSLAHIPDGELAVPEMVRVTRPGGRVAVFERDTDASIISHPDRETTRRIVQAGSDYSTVDGWLARRMPGLFVQAGLEDVRVQAFTPFERDPAGFYGMLLWSRRIETALQVGAISEAEARRWLEQLEVEQEAGRFLAGQVQIFTWGVRPLVG
jgi:SAM-dependent methyltransferase